MSDTTTEYPEGTTFSVRRYERDDGWSAEGLTSLAEAERVCDQDIYDFHVIRVHWPEHVWQHGRFTGTTTCERCGLLPLDADDVMTACVSDS